MHWHSLSSTEGTTCHWENRRAKCRTSSAEWRRTMLHSKQRWMFQTFKWLCYILDGVHLNYAGTNRLVKNLSLPIKKGHEGNVCRHKRPTKPHPAHPWAANPSWPDKYLPSPLLITEKWEARHQPKSAHTVQPEISRWAAVVWELAWGWDMAEYWQRPGWLACALLPSPQITQTKRSPLQLPHESIPRKRAKTWLWLL